MPATIATVHIDSIRKAATAIGETLTSQDISFVDSLVCNAGR